MIAILKSFLSIMTFRQGPESIPFSPFLAKVSILTNILISVTTNAILLTQDSFTVTLIRTILILSINTFLIWLLLILRNHRNRFFQTITAFMGCDALISAGTLVFLSMLGGVESSIGGIITSLLALWSIFIYGFIFYKSFEIRLSLGIISAFILIMFSYRVSQFLIEGL